MRTASLKPRFFSRSSLEELSGSLEPIIPPLRMPETETALHSLQPGMHSLSPASLQPLFKPSTAPLLLEEFPLLRLQPSRVLQWKF